MHKRNTVLIRKKICRPFSRRRSQYKYPNAISVLKFYTDLGDFVSCTLEGTQHSLASSMKPQTSGVKSVQQAHMKDKGNRQPSDLSDSSSVRPSRPITHAQRAKGAFSSCVCACVHACVMCDISYIHLPWIYVVATTLEGVALNEGLPLKTSQLHCARSHQKSKQSEKSNLFCHDLCCSICLWIIVSARQGCMY